MQSYAFQPHHATKPRFWGCAAEISGDKHVPPNNKKRIPSQLRKPIFTQKRKQFSSSLFLKIKEVDSTRLMFKKNLNFPAK